MNNSLEMLRLCEEELDLNVNVSNKELAQKLGVSAQWVRELKSVIRVKSRQPILAFLLEREILALSSTVNSISQYGDEFIDNLEHIYKHYEANRLDKLTPLEIEKALLKVKIGKGVNGETDGLHSVIDSHYDRERQRIQSLNKNKNTNVDITDDAPSFNSLVKSWHNIGAEFKYGGMFIDVDRFSRFNKLIEKLDNSKQ